MMKRKSRNIIYKAVLNSIAETDEFVVEQQQVI